MAKIPEEKRRAVAEAIFALEPYMNAALEGDMLPDYERGVEWFDGEDSSVLLNLKTGEVLTRAGRGFFWEAEEE